MNRTFKVVNTRGLDQREYVGWDEEGSHIIFTYSLNGTYLALVSFPKNKKSYSLFNKESIIEHNDKFPYDHICHICWQNQYGGEPFAKQKRLRNVDSVSLYLQKNNLKLFYKIKRNGFRKYIECKHSEKRLLGYSQNIPTIKIEKSSEEIGKMLKNNLVLLRIFKSIENKNNNVYMRYKEAFGGSDHKNRIKLNKKLERQTGIYLGSLKLLSIIENLMKSFKKSDLDYGL
jgi:hypothetical protein